MRFKEFLKEATVGDFGSVNPLSFDKDSVLDKLEKTFTFKNGSSISVILLTTETKSTMKDDPQGSVYWSIAPLLKTNQDAAFSGGGVHSNLLHRVYIGEPKHYKFTRYKPSIDDLKIIMNELTRMFSKKKSDYPRAGRPDEPYAKDVKLLSDAKKSIQESISKLILFSDNMSFMHDDDDVKDEIAKKVRDDFEAKRKKALEESHDGYGQLINHPRFKEYGSINISFVVNGARLILDLKWGKAHQYNAIGAEIVYKPKPGDGYTPKDSSDQISWHPFHIRQVEDRWGFDVLPTMDEGREMLDLIVDKMQHTDEELSRAFRKIFAEVVDDFESKKFMRGLHDDDLEI